MQKLAQSLQQSHKISWNVLEYFPLFPENQMAFAVIHFFN
jgi:hypothetical protein